MNNIYVKVLDLNELINACFDVYQEIWLQIVDELLFFPLQDSIGKI